MKLSPFRLATQFVVVLIAVYGGTPAAPVVAADAGALATQCPRMVPANDFFTCTVVNASGGKTIQVAVREPDGRTSSRTIGALPGIAVGQIPMAGVPAGTSTVTFTILDDSGAALQTVKTTVTGSATRSPALACPAQTTPGTEITCIVDTPPGDATQAYLSAWDPSGRKTTTVPLTGDGIATLPGLEPGTYQLNAAAVVDNSGDIISLGSATVTVAPIPNLNSANARVPHISDRNGTCPAGYLLGLALETHTAHYVKWNSTEFSKRKNSRQMLAAGSSACVQQLPISAGV